jgi:hypothetical protein
MPTGNELGYDLQLAWRRLKSDWKDRCFINHPFLLQLIELDSDGWLNDLNNSIGGGYNPSPATVCYEPKPGWLLRPGCALRPNDELVYTAIVGSLLPKIEPALRWAQGNPDVSYMIQRNYSSVEWVKSGFLAWDNFRRKSLIAARRSEFVVYIDISAFYENIDIGRLISDLKGLGVQDHYVGQLSSCLNRWSEPRGKGIPQGYTASDILAKLYLNSIDQAIRNGGFEHLRYVDDIRVFCANLREAKASLHLIIDRLRVRGLNVQSAKTEITRADKAIEIIDGVAPLIGNIAKKLADELREFGIRIGDYPISLEELSRLFAENETNPSVDVLVRVFASHFTESAEEEFNRTLFHYLLTRLGLVKSREAIEFCLNLLPKRPEETRFILKYFKDIGTNELIVENISRDAASRHVSSDYQVYQIIKFLHEERAASDGILDLARRLIEDRNKPLWLRSYAYALLGRLGMVADLELIESMYSNAESELEKADMICAMYRYEASRRNGVLARASRDGKLVERAIRLVRQGSIGS